MAKLSIASGGATYDPKNSHYYFSPFDPTFTDDEDERITLPGLVMLPEEPRISYKHLPPCVSLDDLDWLPADDELIPVYLK